MERQFTLSCYSTVDLPYSYMESRDIPVLFYTYVVDGVEYDDDMGRDPEALPRFYRFIREGKLPQTSQINVAAYMEFFERLLQKGDLLHIAFTSGQSGSVHNAFLAAEELRAKYPERKLVVIDSLCSSSGYGLLVDSAADLRDQGKSLEEVEQWVLAHRNRVHHQFFSSDMTQFRRTGRVSGAAATVATVLNICPIMRLDDTGSIKAYSKARGKKKAVEVTVETMHSAPRAARTTTASASCATPSVRRTRAAYRRIEQRFPRLKGRIRLCRHRHHHRLPRGAGYRGGVLLRKRAAQDGVTKRKSKKETRREPCLFFCPAGEGAGLRGTGMETEREADNTREKKALSDK